MRTLRVLLFGQLLVQKDHEHAVVLPSLRSQELLCYLLLQRHHSLPREALLELFWKDSSPAQARRNLRQTLWQLQRALPPDPSRVALISTNAGSVSIDPLRAIQTDVAAFEAAFAPVRGVPGEHLDDDQARALQDAVALYRGDLLEGWYQEWCLAERERLQTIFLAMLDKLMGFCELRQRYEAGLLYGEQALRYVRSNERTHRRLMRLFYLAGERAAALHQYERCANILREELDVEPSAATAELYRRIRSDRLDGPLQAGAPPQPPESSAPASGPLLALRERLRQLCLAVSGIQTQLAEDMQLVERALEEWRR